MNQAGRTRGRVRRVEVIRDSLEGTERRALKAAFGEDIYDRCDRIYMRIEEFFDDERKLSSITTYVLEWRNGKVTETRAGRLRLRSQVRRQGGVENSGANPCSDAALKDEGVRGLCP